MNKVATLVGIAASVALAVSLGACGTKTVVPQPTVTVTARPTLTSAVSSPT